MNNQLQPMGFHFSYHKCLTVYLQRVMRTLFDPKLLNKIRKQLGMERKFGYKHFKAFKEEFLLEFHKYRFASLNNHFMDLSDLPNIPKSHFVRDPRDLVVSGYFYHKRGSESWVRISGPDEKDFRIVNGVVPEAISDEMSLHSYLNSCSLEDGLMAEIQFRSDHFKNMLAWSCDSNNCIEFRYEDIIGNELEVFKKLFRHYGFGENLTRRGIKACEKYSAQRQQDKLKHIRDPKPSQYLDVMPKKVLDYFNYHYKDLLLKYDYDI